MDFKDRRVLITGGTGSLGKVLTRRLLDGTNGLPEKIYIFSRDEAKQHFMRLEYQDKRNQTDEAIFRNFSERLRFIIGDIRDLNAVKRALQDVDLVINAAALKQVPSCEYFPVEAYQTNVVGAQNIVQAIYEMKAPIHTVIGISTDKACKPVNVMGMTKALQERIFIAANLTIPQTRFICVRYGNVLASRGSVIPLFHDQIHAGGPVTITTDDMTRFLLPLSKAVDTICESLRFGKKGETFIPQVPCARMVDVAKCLIGDKPIKIQVIGIRPGEKIHEIMVSEEECLRTYLRGEYYAIQSMIPELMHPEKDLSPLKEEYSSSRNTLSPPEVYKLLESHQLLLHQKITLDGEFLK